MTLTVQSAYNDHYVSTLSLGGTGLNTPFAIDNSGHYVTSPELGQVLLVNDCAHVHAADAIASFAILLSGLDCRHNHTARWIIIVYGGTDDLDPPKLPDMRIDAQAGERGEMDEYLSSLSLESRSGSRLDKKLPDLECEATALGGGIATLDRRLSGLEGEARGGARADSLRLPDMRIEATLPTRKGTLDRRLTPMTIDASGTSPLAGVLDVKVPTLQIDASGDFQPTGTLDKTLPHMQIEADIISGQLLTVDAKLSDLRIDASGYSPDMTLDANLPTLVMRPIGSGSESGHPGEGAILSDDTRFDDYVLRYAR